MVVVDEAALVGLLQSPKDADHLAALVAITEQLSPDTALSAPLCTALGPVMMRLSNPQSPAEHHRLALRIARALPSAPAAPLASRLLRACAALDHASVDEMRFAVDLALAVPDADAVPVLQRLYALFESEEEEEEQEEGKAGKAAWEEWGKRLLLSDSCGMRDWDVLFATHRCCQPASVKVQLLRRAVREGRVDVDRVRAACANKTHGISRRGALTIEAELAVRFPHASVAAALGGWCIELCTAIVDGAAVRKAATDPTIALFLEALSLAVRYADPSAALAHLMHQSVEAATLLLACPEASEATVLHAASWIASWLLGGGDVDLAQLHAVVESVEERVGTGEWLERLRAGLDVVAE